MKVKITRSVMVPDKRKVAIFEKVPQLGPKILFFSGGSALRSLSQHLIRYTYNSIHLMTPFDSGGSSAKIRQSFGVIAVGDIRNRIMALADQSIQGNPEIFLLFAYRFAKDTPDKELEKQFHAMILGEHPLVKNIPHPMRKIIRNHLLIFKRNMPSTFPLQGASIGNLILMGGYLNSGGHIDPVIFLFTKLVEARGTVRPITGANLQLAVELANGKIIIGQHLISGKETSPLNSPVRKVFLTADQRSTMPLNLGIRTKIKDLIRKADLICYPIGSFFSSVVANLLPHGVGQAVSENDNLKVFIPNTTYDPEQTGLNVYDTVVELIAYLRKSCDEEVSVSQLLNFVVVDSKNGDYRDLDIKNIKALGVEVLDLPLANKNTHLVEEHLLNEILLSLC